jgi:hypothetical protein
MRRLLFLALTLCAVASLVACGSAGSALTGKSWQLTAITEKVPAFQGVIPADDRSRQHIELRHRRWRADPDLGQRGDADPQVAAHRRWRLRQRENERVASGCTLVEAI